MKRLFIATVVLACATAFSSFRSEPGTAPASFYKQFHGATSVNWSDVDGMLRIAFCLNGRHQYAFYSGDDLLVLATEIGSTDLPEDLHQQLKSFKGYELSQAYLLQNGSTKEYFAVLDNSNTHLTLKGKKHWKVFLKEKK